MRDMRASFVLPLLFLGVVVQAPMALAQPAGTFTATGNMITPRFFHTATLLPNGKVLIVGGYTVCGSTCGPAGQCGTLRSRYRYFHADRQHDSGVHHRRCLASRWQGLDRRHRHHTHRGQPGTLRPLQRDLQRCRQTGNTHRRVSTTLLNDGRVLLSGTVGTFPPYRSGCGTLRSRRRNLHPGRQLAGRGRLVSPGA